MATAGSTLYISDLDGTLLSSSATLSAFSTSTINRLVRDSGLRFTIATARSFLSAKRVLASLDLRLPMIVYGGALLVAPDDGAVLDARLLPASVLDLALEACDLAGVPPLVFWLEDGIDRVSWIAGTESAAVSGFLADRAGDRRLLPLGDWSELDHGQSFYLSAIGPRERVVPLAESITASTIGRANPVLQQDIYRPEETWFEVTGPGASKAAGAIAVRALVGARSIIAFGDNANDLPLFAAADAAYAVANAIPELRDAATATIGTNDDDGVAAWLVANASGGD